MAGKLIVLFTALAVPSLAQSKLCAGCHPKIAQTYRKTGMGRAFYKPTAANVLPGTTYYHAPSESYFTNLERDSEFFQRRHQLDPAGREVNIVEKRIDFIMGSGNHARAYLNRTPQGKLFELPLAWYSEKAGYFAMNPGYDRPDHEGFRRPINYECMFCHNGYPKIPAANLQPFAEPLYEDPLPQGIDCQRCHSDGANHIKLASSKAPPAQIRAAITNPARLNRTRREELCIACHLEATSFPLPNAITRYNRGPFSYKPGEPLGDFLVNFDHAPGAGRDDKFEIVSSVYRLRKSACYIKSAGKLECTTCHDVHNIPRGLEAEKHYNTVCQNCHATVRAANHTAQSNCVQCHMPKRRTEDVVHSPATDHIIARLPPPGDPLADIPERHESGPTAYRGPVALYYPEKLAPTPANELLLAVAQVKQGSNLAAGIPQLTALIKKYQPARAEYYVELADALERTSQIAPAIPYYRQALTRAPNAAYIQLKLGAALRRTNQAAASVETLKRATAAGAVAWHELGLAYRDLNRTTEAIAAINKAIELDPDLPEAHNNLAILHLTTGNRTSAEPALREAIRLKPDYQDAHANLANLLLQSGNLTEARQHFEIALRQKPADSQTRYNYAMLLGRQGNAAVAQRQLEIALEHTPNFADAHLLLAKLFLSQNNATAARPHLEAATANPATRPEAADLLRQIRP